MQLAIVVDNKDGEGNPGYRVKVKFPWLNEQETSFWARIAVPMGGADRGTYVLPEIDDQVLVVFEHGDINRPIVVGSLWSRKQEPVEVNQSGKNHTKLIKSRSGHRIIFDDKEGAEKIVIVDKTKKNKIVLDSVNKIVKIESDGDVEVKAKANLIIHSNALKVGTKEGITGKAQSLLTHSAKTFGLKATSVSGSGAGELGGAAAEPAPDPIAERGRGTGGGGAGGAARGGGGGARGGGAGSGGGGPSGASPAAPNPVAPTPIDATTIEIEIIDVGGTPRAGVAWDLSLPDGSVHSGTTGADGLIRRTGITTPGTAHLVLPDFDDEHGRAGGAQTPGAVPYAAGGVDVQVGTRTRVEVEPRIYRGRLTGAHFDTDKTFMRPEAMNGIRLLVRFYQEHQGANVVVSGHADTVGDPTYNVCLSNERARAVAAFLIDDVSVWLGFYRGSPCSKTWGTTEDRMMLSTLTDASGQPFYQAADGNTNTPAMQRYQRARSLARTDGVPDEATRRSLIGDYMALDGTSLPAGTHVESHGCGENHPRDDLGNNRDDLENRRVEIFLFEDAIRPAVPTSCPPPRGCDAYPAWVAATVQTVDFRHAAGSFDGRVIVRSGGTDTPVTGATVHLSGPTSASGTTAADGTVRIDNLAAGHYSVTAHKDGSGDALVSVDIPEGGANPRLDIRLAAVTVDWVDLTARCGDAVRIAGDFSGDGAPGAAVIEILNAADNAIVDTIQATFAGNHVDASWDCRAVSAAWRTDRYLARLRLTDRGAAATSPRRFQLRDRPTTGFVLRSTSRGTPAGFAGICEKVDAALEASRVHYSLKLRLTGAAFSAAKQADAKSHIEAAWNNGFTGKAFHRHGCRRGATCNCGFDCCKVGYRLDVNFVASGEHYAVEIKIATDPANPERSGTSCSGSDWVDPPISVATSYAHEVGHMLGQFDEYPTGGTDPSGVQPANAPTANLMKTSGVTTLFNRHYRWVLEFLNASTGGDLYETIPP
ncbi:MAG TPA: phage baseplate assembly protein V [Kofleriaceae bacterium]